MRNVSAAEVYVATDDLCLVTTYFNPAGYAAKSQTHAAFAERYAESGLRLVTIECAFGDADFELAEAPGTIRVRARDVMWQKERLLDLAIAQLPARYTKVAWIDFDVRFENPAWAVETSRALDRFPLVHPFDTAIWLPPGAESYRGAGDVWQSFGAANAAEPGVARRGDFGAHGHPGFVWAARRELLERHGIYDACVVGGADHLVAHAAVGDWESACFRWTLGVGTPHHRHFARWAERFYADVRGEIGVVPGALLHLWHGSWERRNYTDRNRALRGFGFDPEADVRVGENGCWEWASAKPEMHAWAAAYFASRREDKEDE